MFALNIRFIASYRRLTFAVLAIASLFAFSSVLAASYVTNYISTQFTLSHDNEFNQVIFHSSSNEPSNRLVCTPEQYSAGYWQRRPQSLFRPMLAQNDVYPISGFQGCASSREVNWHLGSDGEEDWVRPWRGNVSAYDWIPGSGCEIYSKPTQEELIIQLVERGGWLILGDSISENHFFSLSCILYPHVRATPKYTAGSYFDRAWQQDLFLEKTSPLVSLLRFPIDFDIDTTPLVTFRRVDLLLGKQELVSVYQNMSVFQKDTRKSVSSNSSPKRPIVGTPDLTPELFSDEAVWDLDPDTYLPLFLSPSPLGNYNTMILSTGGHWTTSLFSGFYDESVDGNGLANLLQFFEKAMTHWLKRIKKDLDNANLEPNRNGSPRKQVIVRAYHPGHDGCHEMSILSKGPIERYESSMSHSYNWKWISRYNTVFKSLIQQSNHPNVHFLSIDNPGLLRPDGHVTGDCLHILSGAGILEGWSQYISYFLNFLP